jgi:hypothetical protein
MGHTNLEATVSDEVNLSVDPVAVVLNEFVGMARVTVHVVVTIGSTAVREEDKNLVSGLGVLGEVVL